MGPDEFWSLTWWDWNLWIDRILFLRQEKKLNQEYEWERLSELLCPIYNFMRDTTKKPTPFSPTDFFKPSWYKEGPVEQAQIDSPKKELPKKWEDLVAMVNKKREDKKKQLDG